MNECDWQTFLTEYSRELLASERVREQLPEEVIASNWLGYPPAYEQEIEQVEVRIGARLPASYRSFLRVSNGWRFANTFIYKLWSTQGVAWFSERNQEWIDAYVEPASNGKRLSDEEYLVYGDDQDTVMFREEYLQSALEISEEGDAAIFLLNPKIVTPDGEWEAWFFADWFPGARRYRSFGEMMVQEREDFRNLMSNTTRKRA